MSTNRYTQIPVTYSDTGVGAGVGGVAAAFMLCCVKETLVKQPQYEQVLQEKVAAGGLNEGEDEGLLSESHDSGDGGDRNDE